MDTYEWKDAFNVGIAEMDAQHKFFMECLKNAARAAGRGNDTALTQDLIGVLRDYAATHFRYEERVMQAHGYQGVDAHRKMHAYFESLVAELDASAGATKLQSVLAFQRDWFLKHILEQDKQFASLIP